MVKEKKVKMTQEEMRQLKDMIAMKDGLDVVMESQMRVGKHIKDIESLFWGGIAKRLGTSQAAIKVDLKTGYVTWTEVETKDSK
ncbi:hypothetical protein LCGC14_0383350 [marine sediment metagenome]|uniref:Uncharacterized protein n=1 Tax=marine sediment metagenome TaxID=412755 RepID=A0A0F9VNW2_9ZZZZ